MLPPIEDIENWLKFSYLCRKNGRISQARSTLIKLLQVRNICGWKPTRISRLIFNFLNDQFSFDLNCIQYDPETSPENVRYHGPPQVMLAYLKYQWSLGEDLKRKEAFGRLQV